METTVWSLPCCMGWHLAFSGHFEDRRRHRVDGPVRRHLRHLLRSYATYYNAVRTHLSVNKDAPSPRTVHAVGRNCLSHFLADIIICTCVFDFRQAQACSRASKVADYLRRLASAEIAA